MVGRQSRVTRQGWRMESSLAAGIRLELRDFVAAAGTRRSLPTTCHVGHPTGEQSRWLPDVTTDPSLRADLVERAGKEMTGRWEVTVVEGDEGLLGFLALAPHEQRLDQLFIAPCAQRRGIGAQLLNLAKQRLVNGFWLSADAGNKVAASFYIKEGLTLKRVETSGANARAVYGFDP